MGTGIEAVGDRPFSTDPGRISGPVLRTFAELLLQQLGPELGAYLLEAAATVGQAGVWAALVDDGRPLEHLVCAIQGAIARCHAHPEEYRRLGSTLCLCAQGPPASRPTAGSSMGGPMPAEQL
jgi:hypothetical protein